MMRKSYHKQKSRTYSTLYSNDYINISWSLAIILTIKFDYVLQVQNSIIIFQLLVLIIIDHKHV